MVKRINAPSSRPSVPTVKSRPAAAPAKKAATRGPSVSADGFEKPRPSQAARLAGTALSQVGSATSTGSQRALTASDLASADARRLEQLAATDPRAAAALLTQCLKDHADPAYRQALVTQAAPALTELGATLMQKAGSLTKQDLEAVMSQLCDAAALAGPLGPQLGSAFGVKLPAGALACFSMGDVAVPSGPISATLSHAVLSGMPGSQALLAGLVSQATGEKNIEKLALAQTTLGFTTTQALEAFSKAKEKVDTLNGQLAQLVQGFGQGADPAKIEAAVKSFKARHAKEYDAFEKSAAALAPLLEQVPALVKNPNVDPMVKVGLMQALEKAPELAETRAGQALFQRAVEGQSQGRASILELLPEVARHASNTKAFCAQAAQAVTEAVGARATQLIAQGRKGEAKALLSTLSKNAQIFGLTEAHLNRVELRMGDLLEGKSGSAEALAEELNTGVDMTSALLGDAHPSIPALKGLGLALGITSLPAALKGVSGSDLPEKIRALAQTLDITQKAGSMTLKLLGKSEQLKSLDALFDKVGTGASVVMAAVDVFSTLKSLGEGDFQGATVSGLDATSGILLLIPGLQVAGVGVALASYVAKQLFGEANERKAQRGIEKDGKAFLIDAGLTPDLAAQLSNVNGAHQNIGHFLEEVAQRLGLTQRQLFERLNTTTGPQRKVLLDQLASFNFASDMTDRYDLLFGPRPTLDDLNGVDKLIGKRQAQKILTEILAARDAAAKQVALELKVLGVVK